MIFFGRAEVGDAGRLGRDPPLAVVDAPGVNQDHRRMRGLEAIGHLDNASSVIRKAPSANIEVPFRLIDERRRFVAALLNHRLDEFRIVGQQGLGILDHDEAVLIDSRVRFLSGRAGDRRERRQ
jgi:hypothetical protein